MFRPYQPKNKNSYQSQVNLINIPNHPHPVYIGVRGVNNPAKKKAGCVDDTGISRWNDQSCVLNPERFIDEKTNWTVELNRAFMEGAILSGRPIYLVTNFQHFNNMPNDGLVGNGVFYELLALQENGYEFHKKDPYIIATRASGTVQSGNLNLSMFDDYALSKIHLMGHAKNIIHVCGLHRNGILKSVSCVMF